MRRRDQRIVRRLLLAGCCVLLLVGVGLAFPSFLPPLTLLPPRLRVNPMAAAAAPVTLTVPVEAAPAPAPPPSCGTALAPPAVTGQSIVVAAGGNLQAALDAAQPGDEIVLQAGATYAGEFVLPNKSGARFITVRSSSLAQLPAGVRVGPSQAKLLARIVGPTQGNGPISTATGAHHFYFAGVEIAPGAGQSLCVVVGLGTSTETTVQQLPHDFVFDRVWIHGDPQLGASCSGMNLSAANVTVANSSITDIKDQTRETQAIVSWNGSGPFTIVNDRLEAAGENVMFGGEDPTIAGLSPSDIVLRYNDFDKPLGWKVGDPSYAGTHWLVKNLLELKNAKRVTIDGNVFQHAWTDGQDGTAVVLTPRNQSGHAPWSTVDTVSFTNNVVAHVGAGIGILGHDDNAPSGPGQNVTIANNLFYDVGGSSFTGPGRWLVFTSGTTAPGPTNVTVDHNTAWQSGDPLVSDTPGQVVTHPGLVFTNNLTLNGPNGIWGDSEGQGDATLATYYPDAIVSGNALVGAPAAAYAQHPHNQFPPTGAPLFVDAAANNYQLASSSAVQPNADGSDPGVDLATVNLVAACRQ